MMFAAILGILCIVTSSFNFAWSQNGHVDLTKPGSQLFDIKEFLNTSKRIWTYYTTEKTSIICKVDMMINISDFSIYFYRSYMGSQKAITELMEGIFSPGEKNAMLVSKRDTLSRQSNEVHGTNETLVWASASQSCGLFKVEPTTGLNKWYELRIKDSETTTRPDNECANYFWKLHERHNTIYKNYCGTIFPPLGQKPIL
uniref:Putative lipocalin-3 1 n=1 Tax=Amblyomma triste TaxID=251400 RepID=A0A023G9F3_AMBTT